MPVRKKNCNCRNSRCLKLYCECFASGLHCESCNCTNCCNNLENAAVRQEAVEATLERNPNAFRPKIAASPGAEVETDAVGRHNKGCHCKKSSCLKKYCECFQANIVCSDICRCVDCKNFAGSSQRAATAALTAAKAARQPPSSASPRKSLSSIRVGAQPFREKISGDDHGPQPGESNPSLGGLNSTLHTNIALAVANTQHPRVGRVVSKDDVDELSRSLLVVSEEAKQERMQQLSVVRSSKADIETLQSPPRKTQPGSALPRMQEVVGTGTTAATTEGEMSPGTKALLCDEGDNAFAQTPLSSARRAETVHDHDSKETHEKRRKYGTEMKSSSAIVERENSVLSELTKNLKKIAART